MGCEEIRNPYFLSINILYQVYIMRKISDEIFDNLDESKINDVSEQIYQLLKEGKEVDEGLLGSIVGGLTGAAIGPAIGKAICKALGLSSGMLYNLLTSRMFTTMVATYIGYKQ